MTIQTHFIHLLSYQHYMGWQYGHPQVGPVASNFTTPTPYEPIKRWKVERSCYF
jgi:hypothetical protein